MRATASHLRHLFNLEIIKFRFETFQSSLPFHLLLIDRIGQLRSVICRADCVWSDASNQGYRKKAHRCSNAILLLFFFIHVFFSLYLLHPFNISLTKYNIYENIVFFFFLFHLHKKYASQYRTIFFLFLLYTENIHFFMSPKNYFQRYSICMYLFCFFLSFNSKK